jgi:N6-adenosine-specific RNA methylase IME4
MWAGGPQVGNAIALGQAYGLQYKTIFHVWVKTYKSGKPVCGLGRYSMSSAELLLVFTKGAPLGVLRNLGRASRTVPQVIHAIRRAHSTKPSEVYTT